MSKGLCPSSRVTMCLSTWSVLENAYMCLKKNVYFRDVMSRKYQFTVILLCCLGSLALLVFCLENLSIDVSGVFKSPTLISPSISPFTFVAICFMYLHTPTLGVYMLMSIRSSS